jgi:hypothetical protein
MKPQTRPFIVEIRSSRRRLAKIDKKQNDGQSFFTFFVPAAVPGDGATMRVESDEPMNSAPVSATAPADLVASGNH